MELALDALNNLQLQINQCGHVFLNDKWKLTNVAVPYSKLYYIKAGSGFLKMNGEIVPLEPGYVYLTPSETTVSCGCTTLEKIYFHISLTSVEAGDLLGQVKGIRRLPFSEAEFAVLVACCQAENCTQLLKLKSVLIKTVLDFMEAESEELFSIKHYSDTVRKALLYIRQNTRANLKAGEIAEQLFVSESKLRKAFRAETGKNLGKYIDEAVFLRAAQLLVEERLSVHDISTALGFCDQFYFARRFKLRYRATPTEYRRHNLYLIRHNSENA